MLAGKDVIQFKKIQDQIINFKSRYETDNEGEIVGRNVTTAVTNALYYAFAKATSNELPFLSMF